MKQVTAAVKTALLIAAGTVALGGSVVAAPHSASGIILTYDLNKDQSLPLEEFVDARRARFAASDKNGDGVLDESEYVYEWEGKMEARLAEDRKASVKQTHIRFHAVDKNDDDRITLDEVEAVGERSFAHMDADKDGVVAKGDPEPAPRRASQSDADSAPTLEQRPMLRMPTSHNIEGFVTLYDQNGDDVVTKDEFNAVREAQFQRTDENSDGSLTEQEYVLEFEDRLDAQIKKTYDGQIKQTYVRFGVLDTDENKKMTFAEYMVSGFAAFNRYDTNGDGFLTLADPAPKPREREQNTTTTAQASE
jgi:hypothetical protein